MSDLFLTDDEIFELTGYKNPAKQREHLKSQRIPFHTNRCGHPRVARAIIEGRKPEPKAKETWSPSWAPK